MAGQIFGGAVVRCALLMLCCALLLRAVCCYGLLRLPCVGLVLVLVLGLLSARFLVLLFYVPSACMILIGFPQHVAQLALSEVTTARLIVVMTLDNASDADQGAGPGDQLAVTRPCAKDLSHHRPRLAWGCAFHRLAQPGKRSRVWSVRHIWTSSKLRTCHWLVSTSSEAQGLIRRHVACLQWR